MKVKFLGMVCVTNWSVYDANRSHHLRLIVDEGQPSEGSPITATTCRPELPLANDEILVKEWDGNEGITQALLQAGIVLMPLKSIRSGNKVEMVCQLSPAALAEIRESASAKA